MAVDQPGENLALTVAAGRANARRQRLPVLRQRIERGGLDIDRRQSGVVGFEQREGARVVPRPAFAQIKILVVDSCPRW